MVFFRWRFIPAPPLDESFVREVEALYKAGPAPVPVIHKVREEKRG